MTYKNALEFVYGFLKFSSKRDGLNGILKFLNILKNPQNNLKIIHIAGTNAKGSVATYCANVLQVCGFKVGLFTSPYVVCFNERIKINGKFISKKELIDLVLKLKPIAKRLKKEGVFLTTFDFITTIAFLHFFKKKCDFVVLEVGLGGRLDSTNVILNSVVSIITHIDYDHVKELKGEKGELILNIAKEKAGIIKKGGVVVCSSNQYAKVLTCLKKQAKLKKAKIFFSPKIYNYGCTLNYNYFYFNNIKFKTRLLGTFQIENAAVCLTALLKIGIPLKSIKKGLAKAFIPARFEIFKLNSLVVLDGAHNESGVFCLKQSLNFLFNSKTKFIGVYASLKSKDYKKIMFRFKDVFKKVVLTQLEDFSFLNTNVLEKEAKKLKISYLCEKSPLNAVKKAIKMAGCFGVVVVFGSFKLACFLRKFLVKKNKKQKG